MRCGRYAVVLASLGAVVAQEPPRAEITGEARDRAGKPFAGATVTLLHVAHPGLVDKRYVDRVETATDANGRFRATLLAGMPYVAFATLPAVDETYRCTNVHDGVTTGVHVVLEEGELHWQRRIRPAVDAGWRSGLRFVAGCRVGGFLLQESLAITDGLAVLPRFPAPQIDVLAFEDDVHVLTSQVPTTAAVLPTTRLRMAHVVDVAARRLHSIRFVDPAGKPLAGVRVTTDELEPRLPLGRSGADGIAHLPRAGDDLVPFTTIATVPDGVEARIDSRELRTAADGPARTMRIEQAAAIDGRLEAWKGEPAGGQALLFASAVTMDGASSWNAHDRVLRTTPDGAFTIPGRVGKHPFWLAAVLTPAQRARLAKSAAEPPLSPIALLVPPSPRLPRDLGRLRLDDLAPVELRVTLADDRPAAATAIVVVPLPMDARFEDAPASSLLPARTDASGRVRILAPRGADVMVWAVAAGGAAWASARAGGRPCALRLDPRHVLPLRITNPDGEPLDQVRVHGSWSESPKLDAEALHALRCAESAFNLDFPWGSGLTGADGCVDLIVPVLGTSVELQLGRGRGSWWTPLGWFDGGDGKRIDAVFESRR